MKQHCQEISMETKSLQHVSEHMVGGTKHRSPDHHSFLWLADQNMWLVLSFSLDLSQETLVFENTNYTVVFYFE